MKKTELVRAESSPKSESPTRKRATGPKKIWAVPIDGNSRAIARQCMDGHMDAFEWGSHIERSAIMEALAIARALMWGHERGSYELEDCQHVAALIASDVPPSKILLALTGAIRDPFWRNKGVHFRDVRKNYDHWISLSKRHAGKPLSSANKGEAIERWREAFAALPVGLKLSRDSDPDFTHMATAQIDLETKEMEHERAASDNRQAIRALTKGN